MFRLINSKINFKDFNNSIVQSETWTPSIPLGGNKYSDTGVRLKMNVFNRQDSWSIFGSEQEDTFYNYEQYNSDTFDTSPSQTLIAEMFFRIQSDKIVHSRTVYGLIDWLGDIGGIEDVLNIVVMMFIGNYLKFNCSIMVMQSLYNPDEMKHFAVGHRHEGGGPDDTHHRASNTMAGRRANTVKQLRLPSISFSNHLIDLHDGEDEGEKHEEEHQVKSLGLFIDFHITTFQKVQLFILNIVGYFRLCHRENSNRWLSRLKYINE